MNRPQHAYCIIAIPAKTPDKFLTSQYHRLTISSGIHLTYIRYSPFLSFSKVLVHLLHKVFATDKGGFRPDVLQVILKITHLHTNLKKASEIIGGDKVCTILNKAMMWCAASDSCLAHMKSQV